MEYQVRKEFPYDPIRSFADANPFTIMTVFPYNATPFVLKGGANDIDKWVKNWGVPCMARYSYWRHGKARCEGVSFKNFPKATYSYIWNDPSICKREGNKNHRFWLCIGGKSKTLRRLPNRFPDEARELLKGY